MSGSVCELFVWRELGSPWTSEVWTAASARHCHKNSPSRGRQVLPLAAFPLSAPPGPQKKRDVNQLTVGRIGMWLVRGLYGDSPVTKGGNEHAVLVIILCPSPFVFRYVISIIKLPKQKTKDTNASQGVRRKG